MADDAIAGEFYADLGRRLWKVRKREHMSCTELGSELGVHRNTIQRWEAGIGSVDLWTLLRICDVLHVNVMAMLPPTDLVWGRELDRVDSERNELMKKQVEMERDPIVSRDEEIALRACGQ